MDPSSDRFTMASFLLFLVLALAGSNGIQPALAAGDEPPAFTVVELQGHGADKTSLALLKHDRALAGFTNSTGHWHAFPGHEHLFPTSTPLPFGSGYGDLIGGLANLPDVPLGRDAMANAVRMLHAYDPATAADDLEPLKRALASLTVMTCEAQRLQPIADTVNGGWESGTRVAPEHLPLIDHWDTMSYEIVRSERTGDWDAGPFAKTLEKEANIRSKEEALAVVKVLADHDFEQVLVAHGTKIDYEDVPAEILTAVNSIREMFGNGRGMGI